MIQLMVMCQLGHWCRRGHRDSNWVDGFGSNIRTLASSTASEVASQTIVRHEWRQFNQQLQKLQVSLRNHLVSASI